ERMSWCVADIVNIHGPVPLSGNPAFNAGTTPLIFPDLAPGGMNLPGGPYPTGPMPYQQGTTLVPSNGALVPVPLSPSGAAAPLPTPANPMAYPPGPRP